MNRKYFEIPLMLILKVFSTTRHGIVVIKSIPAILLGTCCQELHILFVFVALTVMDQVGVDALLCC